MNRTIRVLLLTSLLGVSACSTPPTNKQVGATAGAVIGGVVGSALTGGSTAGTVAGAGAGAAVGYEIGKGSSREHGFHLSGRTAKNPCLPR